MTRNVGRVGYLPPSVGRVEQGHGAGCGGTGGRGVNGQPTVTVVLSDGERLAFAGTGPAYPLQIARGTDTMDFSSYDAVPEAGWLTHVTAPLHGCGRCWLVGLAQVRITFAVIGATRSNRIGHSRYRPNSEPVRGRKPVGDMMDVVERLGRLGGRWAPAPGPPPPRDEPSGDRYRRSYLVLRIEIGAIGVLLPLLLIGLDLWLDHKTLAENNWVRGSLSAYYQLSGTRHIRSWALRDGTVPRYVPGDREEPGQHTHDDRGGRGDGGRVSPDRPRGGRHPAAAAAGRNAREHGPLHVRDDVHPVACRDELPLRKIRGCPSGSGARQRA